ncbi:hypothetical protein L2E68_06920 [Planktothrix agardhii 1029]|jgi:hypothetical protein|uniref:hypothetical protein n=1 Tax=Planktothrix agardhii TaxID=1160 RepID=UPI001D0A0A43|nr:hypothetical protein [Planktothrix agardhii]MCB8759377.1 hypothetical protein [Planktothrix agardhii 1813]MCB8764880.1 hypothetical protein [Planktothrix agardhii 1809]MCB8782937.1 hypothetical protein [Planktothrix agardhii 1808]MCF3566037.1 hypothetical protein [Planktothrix agardhii 1807]MCF3589220.1 hypothetical protein [Planktothrix agardhii 1029]
MNKTRTIPDAETRARSVANWREVIRKIDAVTLALDELIAMVEEHNRHSPLTLYRLAKYKGEIVQETIKD